MQTIQLPTTPVNFFAWQQSWTEQRINQIAQIVRSKMTNSLSLTNLSVFLKREGIELDRQDFFLLFDQLNG